MFSKTGLTGVGLYQIGFTESALAALLKMILYIGLEKATSFFDFLLNGSLYWIGEGNVVAFDVVVHSHRELQFPAGVDKKNAKFLWQFNGSLCVVECCLDSRWDIWVMNKNGVEDSWSKLLTLEKSGVLGSLEHVYPVAFSKAQNEILLLVDRNRLVWYDCESDIVKNIALCEFPESFELFDYNERRDFFQEGGFKSEQLTTEKDIKYAVEKVMERAKKKKGSFGLNWQHQLCKNPKPNPDIKTLFIDHSCGQSQPNGARAPSPVTNALDGRATKISRISTSGCSWSISASSRSFSDISCWLDVKSNPSSPCICFSWPHWFQFI